MPESTFHPFQDTHEMRTRCTIITTPGITGNKVCHQHSRKHHAHLSDSRYGIVLKAYSVWPESYEDITDKRKHT